MGALEGASLGASLGSFQTQGVSLVASLGSSQTLVALLGLFQTMEALLGASLSASPTRGDFLSASMGASQTRGASQGVFLDKGEQSINNKWKMRLLKSLDGARLTVVLATCLIVCDFCRSFEKRKFNLQLFQSYNFF